MHLLREFVIETFIYDTFGCVGLWGTYWSMCHGPGSNKAFWMAMNFQFTRILLFISLFLHFCTTIQDFTCFLCVCVGVGHLFSYYHPQSPISGARLLIGLICILEKAQDSYKRMNKQILCVIILLLGLRIDNIFRQVSKIHLTLQ